MVYRVGWSGMDWLWYLVRIIAYQFHVGFYQSGGWRFVSFNRYALRYKVKETKMVILFVIFMVSFWTSVLRFAETLNLLWAGGAIISLALLLAVGSAMDYRKR